MQFLCEFLYIIVVDQTKYKPDTFIAIVVIVFQLFNQSQVLLIVVIKLRDGADCTTPIGLFSPYIKSLTFLWHFNYKLYISLEDLIP